jgi:hypothetical protein
MTISTSNYNQSIESIELLGDNIMFITDEATAKRLLKRNPRASITKGSDEDDRFAVIYKVSDCNLMNAVKKA